jgi:hypothetical protein
MSTTRNSRLRSAKRRAVASGRTVRPQDAAAADENNVSDDEVCPETSEGSQLTIKKSSVCIIHACYSR